VHVHSVYVYVYMYSYIYMYVYTIYMMLSDEYGRKVCSCFRMICMVVC